MRSGYTLAFAAAAVALPAPQASSNTAEICPSIDNTIAQSNNFQYYELHCSKWIDSDPIRITETEVGYTGCLTACDGTVGCGVVEYIATNENQTRGSCTIFPSSKLKDGNSNSWTVAVPLGWNGTTAANETTSTTIEVPAAEPTRFGGLAIRSGSDIQYASIAANSLSFWLYKNTTTYCPSAVGSACSNNTAQTIFAHGVNSTTLSLDVSVPGGQQVYVNQPDGQLKFTQAHSANVGNGTVTGFSIDSSTGHLQFENNDWLACPVTDGSYEVRASARILGLDAAQDCLGFAFRPEEVGAAVQSAWQYA